ncbi:DUF4755 domain-containing protein [Magnetovibrio sp. PR-2]|uniref:DUF4755 domain-containing protein n=1 Tax=Magnetovibrio sp. PR-2 TaxID=3120356 RepID=UPI002FCE43FB
MTIQTQVLAEPTKFSLGGFTPLLPAVYLLLVFSVLGIPLILVILIALKFLEKKQIREVQENGLRAFKSFVGDQAKYMDVTEAISKKKNRCLSPAGLATDGNNIFVLDDGVGAKIPWDHVRNWGWTTSDAPVRYGRTGFGGVEDVAVNQQEAVKAIQSSGFFVSVSDVEKPRWQFMTKDEDLLNKWMEIFTQIDEEAQAKTA